MAEHTLEPEEVEHVAHLARLSISDEERERFARELGSILHYVDLLQSLDTENVEATLGVQPQSNVFREDTPREPLGPDKALANAPLREGNYFRIPRILEE
ncbi:MAG: Asp-tRNA(Asn)/Glu-tRNA(Gln) amidotransferase subunit GatC [Armatimonadetes bacterium]|nr:Asp-tRNA(Asn)/Glu-tRNA(Gln) amidotransferase subunit GatC [Armatimonadota bacterium]